MAVATIDTGTTNTRVKIWEAEQVIGAAAMEVGVRDTAITGSKRTLQDGVKAALGAALDDAGLTAGSLSLILASGMITSNVGLYEVPHLIAPAGINELAQGMIRVEMAEVSDQPIWLIPGIKNNVFDISLESCDQMDIMRGEETESIGILQSLCWNGPALIVLPGSHSKFINLNGRGQMTGCMTSLAGELLSLITKNAIISSSLNHSFSQGMNEAMVLKGAQYARELGINRACFLIRIIEQFLDYTTSDKANFLEGIIFGSDLMAVQNSRALKIEPEIPVIIGGSKPLRRCFEILFKNDPYFKGEIHSIGASSITDLAGYGAIMIAKVRGLI